MKILHLNANPKPVNESVSKQLTESFFQQINESNEDISVTSVDLTENIPPQTSYDLIRHFWTPLGDPEYKPTPAERRAANWAREQGRVFNDTDVLVITTPMWNFSLPATLKGWIDQVVQPGLSFVYGPNGLQPLHRVKKVILLVASAGAYPDGDPLTMQVKFVFNFIGITDIQYAWADGQNAHAYPDAPERVAKARKKAIELADELVRETSANVAILENEPDKKNEFNQHTR